MSYVGDVTFIDLHLLGRQIKRYGYWTTYIVVREKDYLGSRPSIFRSHFLLLAAYLGYRKKHR